MSEAGTDNAVQLELMEDQAVSQDQEHHGAFTYEPLYEDQEQTGSTEEERAKAKVLNALRQKYPLELIELPETGPGEVILFSQDNYEATVQQAGGACRSRVVSEGGYSRRRWDKEYLVTEAFQPGSGVGALFIPISEQDFGLASLLNEKFFEQAPSGKVAVLTRDSATKRINIEMKDAAEIEGLTEEVAAYREVYPSADDLHPGPYLDFFSELHIQWVNPD